METQQPDQAEMGSVDPSKLGRNDPCVCGSGKKFKKCCLEKFLASKTATEAPASQAAVAKQAPKGTAMTGPKQSARTQFPMSNVKSTTSRRRV